MLVIRGLQKPQKMAISDYDFVWFWEMFSID